jgi:hypothetical protein
MLSTVDSFRYITALPTGPHPSAAQCASPIFWRAVQQKETIIPQLIAHLDDTTTTDIFVPIQGGNYCVADIAYLALQEIIADLPTFQFLGVAFDEKSCGYCSYWNYLRESTGNRLHFKQKVSHWYAMHKTRLIWVKDSAFLSCDCGACHPNEGHFVLKKDLPRRK